MLARVRRVGNRPSRGRPAARRHDQELPPYWNKEKVKITKDQEEKIIQIQGEYSAKVEKLDKEIAALHKEIAALYKERLQKQYQLLNDTQKKELREIYLQKLGIDPFAEPKKVEPDKGK
jgi:hypothetical protein